MKSICPSSFCPYHLTVERLKKRIEELNHFHVKGMVTPLSERIDELQKILGEEK